MQLFYNSNITEESTEVVFDKEESRHIVKVLRKEEGDILNLTNGKGYFFKATLLNTNPKKCIAKLTSSQIQTKTKYDLHLAVAPTKLNERYEWFLEKVVEIGVSQITPIICDHSERKVIKPERYEKILQSAMKQSLKAHLPLLHPAISFKEFIEKNHSEEIKTIAHCDDMLKTNLKSVAKENASILILIGPEGDFSKNEITQALKLGFLPVSLGNSRLRTETAAIVACHTIALINEN